ncbi:MAG: hypothetical protein PUD16_04700 [bacterium]|nr:hypothetical protein [bacterium]
MKKILCLLLVIGIFSFNLSVSFAEFSMPLTTVFAVEPIKMLKENLLVPSSLDLREAGMIGLSVDNKSYNFIVIHYVAENKMGGHSDNFAYVLTTDTLTNMLSENPTEAEFVISIGDDMKKLGNNYQMHEVLTEVILQYLINMESWRSNEAWTDLPVNVVMDMVNYGS